MFQSIESTSFEPWRKYAAQIYWDTVKDIRKDTKHTHTDTNTQYIVRIYLQYHFKR